MDTMNLKIGDSVIVKEGIKEPDTEEFEIGGWQGRIIEIDKKYSKENTLISIEWDSVTLMQIPDKFIQQSEEEGFGWQTMSLFESDLDKTVPRDTVGEVRKTQDLLEDKHTWDSQGEIGLRISTIMKGVNPKDEMMCLQRWDKYLEEELSFPIQAIVTESEGSRIIKNGDKVQIKSLSNVVDMYGIIAGIKLNGKSFETPLCDLEVLDTKSPNFQLINDYRVWFANR